MRQTKQLVLAGVMAALVAVGTLMIQVPSPMKGYIHIGDSMVYLSGILLGPVYGAFAAAIGSMFADLYSGYAVYALPTFIIKGLDAAMIAIVYNQLTRHKDTLAYKVIGLVAGVLAGGAVMVSGYLLFETILYGFEGAVVNVVANAVQAVGGGVIAFPIFLALTRAGFVKGLKRDIQHKHQII